MKLFILLTLLSNFAFAFGNNCKVTNSKFDFVISEHSSNFKNIYVKKGDCVEISFTNKVRNSIRVSSSGTLLNSSIRMGGSHSQVLRFDTVAIFEIKVTGSSIKNFPKIHVLSEEDFESHEKIFELVSSIKSRINKN